MAPSARISFAALNHSGGPPRFEADQQRALFHPAPAFGLLFFFLVSWAFLLARPAPAATLRWTGGHATSASWSRNANWDTGTAPLDGDTVVFPAGAARLFNTNDLAGLRLAAIRFTGSGGGYVLRGNGVTLTNGITAANSAGANRIQLDRLTLGADAAFTVTEPSIVLTVASEIRLNGNALTANAEYFLELSGAIAGAGDVIKVNGGTLHLSGPEANTFTGNLLIHAGEVILSKSGGLAVPGRLVVGDSMGGSHADVARSFASEQVRSVTVNASGLWELVDGLSVTNEVADLALNDGGDVTTGSDGKLRLGVGANLTVRPGLGAGLDESQISGHLELMPGPHLITVDDNSPIAADISELLINASISGAGSLTKLGRDNLVLQGTNTFRGWVTISEGEVIADTASALGSTMSGTQVNDLGLLRIRGGISINNESLTLDPADSSGARAVISAGSNSWTGPITLQNDALIWVGANGGLDLPGVISGPGGVTKDGPGTLIYSGNAANTYTGTTFVNQGVLELDKGTIAETAVPGRLVIGDGLGGSQADKVRHRKSNQVNAVTVHGSGLWELGSNEEEVSDLVLVHGGDVTTDSAGKLRLGIGAGIVVTPQTNDITVNSEISGHLELMAGPHTIHVSDGPLVPGDSLDLIINAEMTGLGAILKTGPGEMALFRASTFQGTVTVEGGDLIVGHSLALGTTLSGTRVNKDARLRLTGDVHVAGESLSLDSTGIGLPGDFNIPTFYVSGSNSWTGDVTLLRDTRVGVETNGLLEFSGAITGSGGVIKERTGTLKFSGATANTYQGSTTVKAGRLDLEKSGANTAIAGDLIVGDGAGAADGDVVRCLDILEIAALSAVTVAQSGRLETRSESVGSLAGAGNVSVTSVLTVGDNNTSTAFDGVISGAGALNKHGTGTLTLNGNNTYTGGTSVSGGVLLVNGQQPASLVLVQPQGTVGGVGRVGNLSTFANGSTLAPGASPGRLTVGSLQLAPAAIYRVELDGPSPGATYDQVRAFGTVDLGQAELQAELGFVPTLGQPFIIVDNDGNDPIADRFAGLQEGDTLRLNQISFVISYSGGDGNDVTLTATDAVLSVTGARVEAGNGNGFIEDNECNHLFVGLMNETGGPLAVSRAVLDSATPGVAVTQARSDYPNFPALGIRTNTMPFQFCTTPAFECGRKVEFLLTLTVSGGGAFTIPVSLPSGSAGTPLEFGSRTNITLVDGGLTSSTITVSNAGAYAGKVAVSLHAIHPAAGDLVLRLRSPSGTTVRLASNLGGASDNYGVSCGQTNRTAFDDEAAIRIAAAAAPFQGTFAPQGSLSAFRGENPNGTWTLLINDTAVGDAGELRCWSLVISPPECGGGGGACQSCLPALLGTLRPDGPVITQWIAPDPVASSCGSPKTCSDVIAVRALLYRVHTITNTGPESCITAVVAGRCLTNNIILHAAAYLHPFDPADPCANYLGDSGGALLSGSDHFSFQAPAGSIIAVVVASPLASAGCDDYAIRLYGLPCPPPTLHIDSADSSGRTRLFWSTAYPDFDLQRTPTLNGSALFPFVKVPASPVVAHGNYTVTNRAGGDGAYFRLHKP